jgi:carbamate kinase
MVLAVGGHALGRPDERGYDGERDRTAELAATFHHLAAEGYRLLVVHGNGPQVGRLLRNASEVRDLDLHTAQTQGELGYLLAEAMPTPAVAVVTRVAVSEPIGPGVKPIGAVLETAPEGVESVRVDRGWRVVVPSPKPRSVLELDAISALLATHHVVAGGGGGVPLLALPVDEKMPHPSFESCDAVIDKDWVAALLAMVLGAECLVFATDVDCVYADFGSGKARPLAALDAQAAAALLAGDLDRGSMGPKLESALEFALATGRTARICAVDAIIPALSGRAGTVIGAERSRTG